MTEKAALQKTLGHAACKLHNPMYAAGYKHMPLVREFGFNVVEVGEQAFYRQVQLHTSTTSRQRQKADK